MYAFFLLVSILPIYAYLCNHNIGVKWGLQSRSSMASMSMPISMFILLSVEVSLLYFHFLIVYKIFAPDKFYWHQISLSVPNGFTKGYKSFNALSSVEAVNSCYWRFVGTLKLLFNNKNVLSLSIYIYTYIYISLYFLTNKGHKPRSKHFH